MATNSANTNAGSAIPNPPSTMNEDLSARLQEVRNLKDLLEPYQKVRDLTKAICDPLEPDDYVVQPIEFVSPPKWHLAHTSWFFEHFILSKFYPKYREYHPKYAFLFNSYYQTLGSFHERPKRGWLTRPTISESLKYRSYVDQHMRELLESPVASEHEIRELLVLGLHHEQQHQELLLMDIKFILFCNPLKPVFLPSKRVPSIAKPLGSQEQWIGFDSQQAKIGYQGSDFCYDNELPYHEVYLSNFEIAKYPVTNGEFLEFIESGAYDEPRHWLSDGWATIQQQQWKAPLYWEKVSGNWHVYNLNGFEKLDENEPVSHLSFYEAQAYATWRGHRLPTEFEWEAASRYSTEGQFLDLKHSYPSVLSEGSSDSVVAMLGNLWEWTRSSYLPYDGYTRPSGPLGEYNAKFMCNQMVLRGGCCVTPKSHTRNTYRNFFQPEMRWQYSGLRLAKQK